MNNPDHVSVSEAGAIGERLGRVCRGLAEAAEAERLQASISVLCPDLGRRLPADLPASLLRRVLERVRAEAGWQPMVALVDSFTASHRKGGDDAINSVAQDAGRVKEDALTREELIQRIETWLGDRRPKDEVRVLGVEHGEFAPEAGDLPVEVREGDVLPASDQIENGVFHESKGAEAAPSGQEPKWTVFTDVLAERHRQDDKWGQQNHDPITWLAILGEEVGEASQHALTARFHQVSPPGAGSAEEFRQHALGRFRAEMVQVAAVALAIVECMDRGKWSWPHQAGKEGK